MVSGAARDHADLPLSQRDGVPQGVWTSAGREGPVPGWGCGVGLFLGRACGVGPGAGLATGRSQWAGPIWKGL